MATSDPSLGTFSFSALPTDICLELLQYLCLSPERDVLRLRQTSKENLTLFNLEEILSTLLKLEELIANDYDLSRVPKRKLGFRQPFETLFSYEDLYDRTIKSLIQSIASEKAKSDSFVHTDRWVKRTLLTKTEQIPLSDAPEIYYNALKTALLHKNKTFLDQINSSASDLKELFDFVYANQHLLFGICLKSNDAAFINSFVTSQLFDKTKHRPINYFCWLQQLIQQNSPKQLVKQFMIDFNDQLLANKQPLIEAVSIKWDTVVFQMILEHFSARNEKELIVKSAKIFLSILCEEDPASVVQQFWPDPTQFPQVTVGDTLNRAISVKGVELLRSSNSLKRVFASPAVQTKILTDVLTVAATKNVASLEVAKQLVQEGFEFDRKWTDQILLRKKQFKNKTQVMQFLLSHGLVNASEILLNTVEISFKDPSLDETVLLLVNTVPNDQWHDILGNASNYTVFHLIGQATRALYTWKIIHCVPYHTLTLIRTLLAQGHDIKAVNKEERNLQFYINDSFYTNEKERYAVLQLCQ
jgi:hypothetical protein